MFNTPLDMGTSKRKTIIKYKRSGASFSKDPQPYF